MNRLLFAILMVMGVLVPLASAQQTLQTPNQGTEHRWPGTSAAGETRHERGGTIVGRVILSEGNHPLANALVIARTPGLAGAPSRLATTDEEGVFQLADLKPVGYRIDVSASGYVTEQSQLPNHVAYYRAGDHLTLRMIKGGVITGRVLNANGDPAVMARVHAVKVKDAEGLQLRDAPKSRDWFTDDRGIYRLYGLEPGSYLVAANLNGVYRNAPSVSNASGRSGFEARTYYPSGSVGSAALVTVLSGEEASGIDIRYRSEGTYAVSGLIVSRVSPSGSATAMPAGTVVTLKLTETTTAVTVGSTSLMSRGPKTSFNFDGVPDGVYELTAQMGLGTEAASISRLRRLTVKGADLKGVEVTLFPLGSVAGHLVLEDTRGTGGVEGCQAAQASLVAETLITARREETASLKEPMSMRDSELVAVGQPESRGEFVLRNLNEGFYLLELHLPEESLYVRDISLAGAATKTTSDVARDGLMLKPGERVQGLTITLASGAAKLHGHAFSTVEGASLPTSLLVFLVPVEPGSADNVLRYAAVLVHKDRSFILDHLSPGRYWIVAREAAGNSTSAAFGLSTIREAKTRLQLRLEAERANDVVELKPCQKVADYRVRFGSGTSRVN